MPTDLSFVDTNVFAYRASDQDARKKEIATDLLKSITTALSTQVLQEFYSVATHPKKLAFSHAEAVELLEPLLAFAIHTVDVPAIQRALKLKERYQTSYWDAAIIVSAQSLGCRTIYSEDLSDGQNYDGVRLVNPFASSS